MTCTPLLRPRRRRAFDRPGAGAARSAATSRFRSLQIGVSQESFGGAMQKNMSWAGPDRPLPPEEIPHRLFDRLFGAKDQGWVNRKRSILDAVQQQAQRCCARVCPRKTRHAWTSISPRCAIWSAPSRPCRRSTRRSTEPEEDFDMKDWPRVAKLQSDLLAYALATRPDARRQLHADQVPGPGAISRGSAIPRRAITITRTKTARRPATRARKASGFCATSAAGTSRSSPTWWQS